jgi:hypothetical protein
LNRYQFSEVDKSLFLVSPLHTTSCNVHYSGSTLHDNERETWSKSRLSLANYIICCLYILSFSMEFIHFINLIIIFALNVLFSFSGICLNSLVIFTFWRSAQLRKKLCYFMIMLLSCCDLLVVVTDHPMTALYVMLWLVGKHNLYASQMDISYSLTGGFLTFSLLALLVMNFDRYLATYYPIFHRTSVTKGRLLILLAILIIVELTLGVMSINNFVIPIHASSYSNFVYSCHSSHGVHQLQIVHNCQETS